MKRIYLILLLCVSFAGSALAQRKCDVELIGFRNDTVYYANPPKHYFVNYYMLINHGPDMVNTTDTIKIHSPYKGLANKYPTGVNLYGFSSKVLNSGDTILVSDTLVFDVAYSPNPYNWCDSFWVVPPTGTITDTKLSNNKDCQNIRFLADPLSVGTLRGAENGLSVYPSPASGNLNVKYTFTGNASSLIVTDLMGKMVYSKDLGTNIFGDRTMPIDVSTWSSGMYIVTLSVDNKKLVSKVTVQN